MTTDISKAADLVLEALNASKEQVAKLEVEIQALERRKQELTLDTDVLADIRDKVQLVVDSLKEDRTRLQKEIDAEQLKSDELIAKKGKEFTELWEKKNEELRERERKLEVERADLSLKIEEFARSARDKADVTDFVTEISEEAIKSRIWQLDSKEKKLDSKEAQLKYQERGLIKLKLELENKQRWLEDREKTFKFNSR